MSLLYISGRGLIRAARSRAVSSTQSSSLTRLFLQSHHHQFHHSHQRFLVTSTSSGRLLVQDVLATLSRLRGQKLRQFKALYRQVAQDLRVLLKNAEQPQGKVRTKIAKISNPNPF